MPSIMANGFGTGREDGGCLDLLEALASCLTVLKFDCRRIIHQIRSRK